MYALIVLIIALFAGKSHKALDSYLQFLLLVIIAVIIVDALLLRRSITKLAKSGCRASRPAASRSTRSCAPSSCAASATRRRGSSPATSSRRLGLVRRPVRVISVITKDFRTYRRVSFARIKAFVIMARGGLVCDGAGASGVQEANERSDGPVGQRAWSR